MKDKLKTDTLSFFKKNKNGLKAILYLMITLGVVIFFYFYNPVTKAYPSCPFYHFTGLYCPGCGSSRAVYQIVHGNFLYALNLNPLMIISIPFIFYLLMAKLNIKIRGKVIFKRKVFTKKFYVFLIVMIALYSIIRNIPAYPFCILAP